MELPTYPATILELITQRKSVIIVGHVNPDGDCLSSEISLGKLLSGMGKKVVLANAGPFERTEIAKWKKYFVQEVTAEMHADDPLLIVTDCSTSDRIGTLYQQTKGLKTVVIDHHASGDPFGDERYIVPSSPSTTLLIQHLYHALKQPISKDAASFIFFGFATDTGYFRFINAGQGFALDYVSELVDLGVSPNAVYMTMTGGKSLPYIHYLGALIQRSEPFLDGKVMCSFCYQKDKEMYGEDRPSDLFYSQMLSVEGVQVVMLFKELPEGNTEVGFRSSHDSAVDVGILAATYGGGGHKHASGVTVARPIEEIRGMLLKDLTRQLS
ncbi:MAG: bifunctional oligoribonuclease/PAP phosphatase NrnA [Sphaerochaeta sp.]|jgi:phosphoesterase RecJ-like protein|nr:bifunctional oligoribonuclease/PAP phosphatase NrnA [Sphaerochaeta sp.]